MSEGLLLGWRRPFGFHPVGWSASASLPGEVFFSCYRFRSMRTFTGWGCQPQAQFSLLFHGDGLNMFWACHQARFPDQLFAGHPRKARGITLVIAPSTAAGLKWRSLATAGRQHREDEWVGDYYFINTVNNNFTTYFTNWAWHSFPPETSRCTFNILLMYSCHMMR